MLRQVVGALEHCAQAHELVTSDALLDEYHEKLVKKFRLPPDTADARVALLRSQMEVVQPASLPSPICRDPDDDQVLAAAMTANCRCIVTGDQDLLVLGSYSGVAIISPGEFAAFELTE
jgi:putative PIN family toxin of toxin-antitoxin system